MRLFRWEYTVIEHSSSPLAGTAHRFCPLRRAGRDGYELVHVLKGEPWCRMLFKRRVWFWDRSFWEMDDQRGASALARAIGPPS